MTAARQERKSRHWSFRTKAFVGLLGVVLMFSPAGKTAASEPVIANRYSGLAIDGFDPLAYFLEGKPRAGRPEFEMRSEGAVWRFTNEGNRAAFAADPEVYAPRFGGHDPVAIVRGAATPGHPELWVIEENRLYLFYSEEARTAFARNPSASVDAAERYWPAVKRMIPR